MRNFTLLLNLMLPQANENSSKNDAFAFRLEMLNKELDYIHSSIRKMALHNKNMN